MHRTCLQCSHLQADAWMLRTVVSPQRSPTTYPYIYIYIRILYYIILCYIILYYIVLYYVGKKYIYIPSGPQVSARGGVGWGMLTSCSWYVDGWGGVGWGMLTSYSSYVDGWGGVGWGGAC